MRHPMRLKTEGTHSSQSGFSLIEVIVVVIIIMIMAAMAAKWMGAAVANYRLSGTAREIAAAAQLARTKATTRDARFRVLPNTGARTYRTEFKTRTGSWGLDPLSADYPLPAGVNFSTTGITPISPGETTVTQATAMVFNTRGLLINDSTGAPVSGRCFYLQGNTDRPFAVCANLTGKVTVYRLFGSVWEIQ